jgi:hypothetical protein
MIFSKTDLEHIYLKERKSVRSIAEKFGCSQNKVNYWLGKYGICKRTIAEALYLSHNPKGDPFNFKKPSSIEEGILYGLGLGLYWGEGNKRNMYSVRLGNTDPALIKAFLKFLSITYGVKKKKLRFGLQIFSDMKPDDALRFWSRELGVSKASFSKVIVTPARGAGTYRVKTRHGVLTVCVSNRKLRDLICGQIEKLQEIP